MLPADIIALRTRLGWSQAQIARVVGVGGDARAQAETVRRWERAGCSDRLFAAILARLRDSADPAAALAAARDDDPLAAVAVLLGARAESPAPLCEPIKVPERPHRVKLTADDVRDTRAALRRSEGSVPAAARLMGMTPAGLKARMHIYPECWPEDVPQQGRSDDDDVARETRDAIRSSAGNIALAAHALGIERITLFYRLKNHPEMWPDEVPRRHWTAPAAITEALRAADGDIAEAAKALGLRRNSIYSRLRDHPELWPDGVPRQRDDGSAAVTEAIRAAGGNLTHAARALGVSRQAVAARIKNRPELWPEGVQRARGRAAPTPAPIDAEPDPDPLPARGGRHGRAEALRASAEALRASGGAVRAAARALGIPLATLYSRLRAHPELRRGEVPVLPPPPLPDPDPHAGRRVGALELLGSLRGADGRLWVRARCDCGRETQVRASHVAPGARNPVLSCGCEIHRLPRTCYAGEVFEGGDHCVVDDGADHVTVRCPDGHTWEVTRAEAHARHVAGPGDARARTICPRCRVRGTVDIRGEVFGMLEVLRRAGTDAPEDGRYAGQATWWVRCECGTEKVVRGAHLRREVGAVKTCGARECVKAWKGR